MLSNLRNYSKIIIIVVAVAMVVSGALYGALYGFGAFNTSTENNPTRSENIAEVNGTDITQQEYYSVLRSQLGMNNLNRSQEIPFKYNVLSSIIDRNLILQKADELSIDSKVTEEDVNEYIDQILEDNEMTEEELVAYLEERNSSLKKFKGELKENLKVNNRIKQVQEHAYGDLSVSEAEIAESYEGVKVQIIAKSIQEDKDSAKSAINEALQKIENGAEFKDVADEYSDYNRVDLGMINQNNNTLPDNITNKAFEMEKGQVSNILEDKNAYYIIKVLDKKVASGEDYEDAKEDIRLKLLKQKQNEVFAEWLKNLKAESDILIYDPLLSGYKALSNENYNIAISELETSLEDYPMPMTYVYMAEAYRASDQREKAIETFDKAVEKYPNDWELHFNYANMLMGEEELDQDKVIGLLDEVSTLAGDNFNAHYQLYMLYSQLGASEKAQAEMEKLTEINKKMQEQQKSQEDNQDVSSQGADANSETTSDDNE